LNLAKATSHEFAVMRSQAYGAKKLQQQFEEQSRREALANDKLQSEMQRRLKAQREKQAREEVRAMSAMRAEGYRAVKMTRLLEEASAKEALENAKVQCELGGHARRTRMAFEKEQRRGQSETRYQAYKAKKMQREFEAQSEAAALANARIQSEMQAHVSDNYSFSIFR